MSAGPTRVLLESYCVNEPVASFSPSRFVKFCMWLLRLAGLLRCGLIRRNLTILVGHSPPPHAKTDSPYEKLIRIGVVGSGSLDIQPFPKSITPFRLPCHKCIKSRQVRKGQMGMGGSPME
ncbi:hypothetical protein AVEN_92202-1 [Araneus ventricosus]|uniref:Uncharacterized protein n=1 Tax=Araneus ventricosus TaxID=182803 RepID=A0A4Y2ALZ3_ARAVE|nr:hypothetical protein AVEN_92202-1 [Araneus ventricosus]